FLNLPDEKRNRIVELALDEFSSHPYRQASLSRIVARAGIAKGSMYQYFDNKLDLYQWLVTEELERRREEWLQQNDLGPRDPVSGSRLFAALERMVSVRVGFMLAHPRLARLAASAMEPTVDEELRGLHEALRREQVDGLVDRIREAQALGEIQGGVDVRSLAHFIDALVMRGTANAVLDRLGLAIHEFLAGNHATLREDEWRVLVRQVIDLILNGIRTATSEARSAGTGGSGSDPDPRISSLADAHIN